MLGLMAAVVSSWSSVESAQLSFFVHMFGGRKSTATAALMALESRSARISAINAAAKTVLDDAQLQLLSKFLKHCKTIAKFRDMLAHWQICASPSFKNHLTLRDPNVSEHSGKHPFDSVYKFSEREMVQHILLANQCFIAFSLFRELVHRPNQSKSAGFLPNLEEALRVLDNPGLLNATVATALGKAPVIVSHD
jgi:hypothetical protein